MCRRHPSKGEGDSGTFEAHICAAELPRGPGRVAVVDLSSFTVAKRLRLFHVWAQPTPRVLCQLPHIPSATAGSYQMFSPIFTAFPVTLPLSADTR